MLPVERVDEREQERERTKGRGEHKTLLRKERAKEAERSATVRATPPPIHQLGPSSGLVFLRDSEL